jgi:hypothetical protein
MAWGAAILLFMILLCGWLLLSSIHIELDTRVPLAGIKWGMIGHAKIWYEESWKMHVHVPFYKNTFSFSGLKRKPRKMVTENAEKKKKKQRNRRRVLKMLIPLAKTFSITEWKLALDTGDYSVNAPLYPLNFLPFTFGHLLVNFQNENYLVLKVRNRPWKILIVFLKNHFLNQ